MEPALLPGLLMQILKIPFALSPAAKPIQTDFVPLLTEIKQTFDCEGQDVRAYSPLTLAYIGDGIYELVIRSIVVERANRSANDPKTVTVS